MNKFYILLLLFSLIILWGCRPTPPSIEENYDYLTEYHRFSQTDTTTIKASSEVDIYIDYSNGMYAAITQAYDFFSHLFTIIDNEKARFFSVGENENPVAISKNDILDNSASPYYAQNTGSYTQSRSKLKSAIQEIVKHTNKQALFITDFEFVETSNLISRPNCQGQPIQTDINTTNWAKEEFEDWLKIGNAIDVFAHKFESKPGQVQYVYFMVFTPKNMVGASDKASIAYRLRDGGYAKNTENLKWYSFSISDYKVITDYEDKGDTEKGLASELEFDEYHENEVEKFEYYQLDKEAITGAFDYVDEPILLEGLVFKSQLANYTDIQFEIKTTNITSNILEYIEYRVNEEEENEEPKKFKYRKGKKVKKVFSLEERDDYELSINMDTDEITSIANKIIYRIDVYLKSGKLEMLSDMDKILAWTEPLPRCLEIKSLSGSLTEAMNRVDLNNRLLYTYYIEINK